MLRLYLALAGLSIVLANHPLKYEICANGISALGQALVPQHPSRRIVEGLLFNDEADMIEIHLNELKNVVDLFVIVESNVTFSGQPKRLVFSDIKDKFLDIADKIVNIVVSDLPEGSVWIKERHLRQTTYQKNLVKKGDIFLLADIDEIVRPTVLQYLKSCSGYDGKSVLFDLDIFYYSYSTKLRKNHLGVFYPRAHVVDDESLVDANQLRGSTPTLKVPNAGWHCSNCFSTMAELRRKVESYSHQEFNLPRYKTKEHLINVVRNGLDWFLRSDVGFDYVEPRDIPQYVKMHMDSFDYMLERRGPTAAFRDFYA